jgi:Flp pilus assembly protein TadG
VEFALIFPIFMLLTFGSISGGIIYWHTISAAQAVRDAARYGSTLPLSMTPTPPATLDINAWLEAVEQVALREGGIGDSNGDGAVDGTDAIAMNAQTCVAFVKGTTAAHTQMTKSRTTGGGTGPPITDPCIASDQAPDVDRVQVIFKRDEVFSAIVINRNFTSQSNSVQPYQRLIK